MMANLERRSFPTKKCIYCKREGSHFSDDCRTMPSLKFRLDLVKREKHCAICLRVGHQSVHGCNQRYQKCHYCSKLGHHRSLCQTRDSSQPIPNMRPNYQGNQRSPGTNFSGNQNKGQNQQRRINRNNKRTQRGYAGNARNLG